MKGVINMKYPKSIILIILSLLLSSIVPLHASAETMFSYSATIDVSPGGEIYYNYGENGRFFLSTDWEEYDQKCLVVSGQTSKFNKLLERGMIAIPKDGYYFAGFYDAAGKKLPLVETNMDIIRVSVDGFYFFNCFPSKDTDAYKRLTKTAYQNQVKLYVKGLYGTTKYKVMDTVTFYGLPKKDGSYKAKFLKKKTPSLNIPAKLTKVYGNKAFYIAKEIPEQVPCTFKSSNSKVLTVNKNTGYTTIKGPGKAKITCTAKESPTTLPAVFSSTITVKPAKIKSLTAKRTKKTLSVKWNASSKNSGYEIQVSNNKSFKNIIARKTITSSDARSTTVKLKSEVCNNYVRIRAYKTSGGEKIYSAYTVAQIK